LRDRAFSHNLASISGTTDRVFSRATVSSVSTVLQLYRACPMLFVFLARCCMCSWQINDNDDDDDDDDET